MSLIDPPAWAPRAELRFTRFHSAQYEECKKHRPEILRTVHAEVEAYVNDDDLTPNDGESFPCRRRLSGEYYLGSESDESRVGPSSYQIAIMARCLERESPGNSDDRDYLGLEIWLRCDPETWSITVFRNTDSSSI